MKKKLTVLLAGVIALTSFTVGAVSKGLIEKIEAEIRGDFTVVIDGKTQTFRDVNGNVVEPILYDGTTYLPIRAIGEIMGKTVYWYQDAKRIELVEPQGETLVTDADVIVDGADKTKPVDKVQPQKPQTVPAEVKITREEAMAIALEKAGVKEDEIRMEEFHIDRDDNRLVYEIEFRHENIEYSAEISVTDGRIVEWDVDKEGGRTTQTTTPVVKEQNTLDVEITLEEAKEIALNKAGLKEADVVFEEAKLDRDDGRVEYDIEFRNGRVEYSAEISAVDGTIRSWDVDYDD